MYRYRFRALFEVLKMSYVYSTNEACIGDIPVMIILNFIVWKNVEFCDATNINIK